MTVRFAVTACVAAMLCAATGGQTAPKQPPHTGPAYPRIANCYAAGLGPDTPRSELDEIARYSLLIGGISCNWSSSDERERLASNIAYLRERNPEIRILDFACSAPYADPTDPRVPRAAWLLQPNGARIDGWPGSQMLNLTAPEALEWLTARAVRSVRDYGLDGVFIDCMASSFDAWACNIATGKPYEVDADGDGKADDLAELSPLWIRAKTQLAKRVRDAIGPSALFMTNQAGAWGRPTMNGILLEDFLDNVLTGAWTWRRVMREYLEWVSGGRQPGVTTIVSSSGIEPPFDAWRTLGSSEREALLKRGRSQEQRMRFGLASTLMGDGYYAFDLHTRWRGQRWWYPEYDAKLGWPIGPAAPTGDGLWSRAFEGGVVLVNASPLDARVTTSTRSRDVSSGRVARSFLVPPHDGRILLRTSDPQAPGTMPDPAPPFTADGPDRVVVRGDATLIRLGKGTAAVLDGNGRITSITRKGMALTSGVSAMIVTDPWRDYGYADMVRSIGPKGQVAFSGLRTDGQRRIRFTESVQPEELAVTIEWTWTAETPAPLALFRPQVDLPVETWVSAAARSGETVIALPATTGVEPRLLGEGSIVSFASASAGRLIAECSAPVGLVDERHFGVDAYRLGLAPAGKSLDPGKSVRARIRLEFAP